MVRVSVYDTERQMQDACVRTVGRWGFPPGQDFSRAGGATLFPYEWDYEDAREHLVSIYLSREQLDLTTIMHEVVHAAMFLYLVDRTGPHSRARKHMTGWNEPFTYLASELFSALIWRFDIIPISTVETAGLEIPA